MEILSLGQKLKRARIYNGYTLKEICENKISVSKLSCIENDKIKPESWVLKHICDKLKLKVEYLNQDVKEQITTQISELNESDKDYIERLQKYFYLAIENNYIELAYKIIQTIFLYYMKNNNLIKCHELIPDYYNFAIKVGELIYLFYLDVGEFIFINGEYNEAYEYFNNVTTILDEENICDEGIYFKALYKKILCLLYLKRYNDAVQMLGRLIEFEDIKLEDSDTISLYVLIGILILLDTGDINQFKNIEDKIFTFVNDSTDKVIKAKYDIAHKLYIVENYPQALIYFEELNKILSSDNIKNLLKEQLLYIKLLVKNCKLQEALNKCDNFLNIAIEKQDDENIEKLYYYKGYILEKMGKYTSAELYYILSLDLLTKAKKNKEMSERYFEIGYLYYKMNATEDAVKYINTAISIKNKI